MSVARGSIVFCNSARTEFDRDFWNCRNSEKKTHRGKKERNGTKAAEEKRREEARDVTEREKEPEATTIERNCRGIAREFQRFERANEH